jgi:hypothetical protein
MLRPGQPIAAIPIPPCVPGFRPDGVFISDPGFIDRHFTLGNLKAIETFQLTRPILVLGPMDVPLTVHLFREQFKVGCTTVQPVAVHMMTMEPVHGVALQGWY